MIQYPVLIDGSKGAYGVVFPDIPGIGAMGDTVDEALLNAEAVLRDYVIETERDGEELVHPSFIDDIALELGEMVAYVTLKSPTSLPGSQVTV